MPDNTRRAYQAQWRLWLDWCAGADVDPLPSDPLQVVNWLAERAEAGQSHATLRGALAAIRAVNAAMGHHFDTGHPAIRTFFKGHRRAKPAAPSQAEPLRAVDISEILASCTDHPTDQRDAALIAIGYIFALRRSELVALDYDALGDGDGSVRITARATELTLVRSKTGAGEPQVVTVPREHNARAVAAIEAWVTTANITAGSPLLRRVRRGGTVTVERPHPQSVNGILQRRIAEHHVRQGVPVETAEEMPGDAKLKLWKAAWRARPDPRKSTDLTKAKDAKIIEDEAASWLADIPAKATFHRAANHFVDAVKASRNMTRGGQKRKHRAGKVRPKSRRDDPNAGLEWQVQGTGKQKAPLGRQADPCRR